MIDFSRAVDILQRELAARYSLDPSLLNSPGHSVACKIDPYYYLAMFPGFTRRLDSWRLLGGGSSLDVLVKTGNLVTGAPGRQKNLELRVVWAEGARQAEITACFLHSGFVDRAMALYGNGQEPPISTLRIHENDRTKVRAYLAGKTQVADLAYFRDHVQ
ncbi:MAG: hypothetical protein D6E12_03405 [Desulfovibrio sp.]|nr:MAG: hypothetical protein D6E12_03405 [Desulfovibrio sp.]